MDEELDSKNEPTIFKVRLKNPNPLFVKWITEWLEEARKRNMQLQYTLEKALESLNKFPLTLQSGKECLILEHFGTGLCEKLDKKIQEYQKAKLASEAITSANPAPSIINGIKNEDTFTLLPKVEKEQESLNKVPENLEVPKESPKKSSPTKIARHVASTCVVSVTARTTKLASSSPAKTKNMEMSPNKNSLTSNKKDSDSIEIDLTADLFSGRPTRNHNCKKNIEIVDEVIVIEESPKRNSSTSTQKTYGRSKVATVAAGGASEAMSSISSINKSPAKKKFKERSPKKNSNIEFTPEIDADSNEPLSQISSTASCSQSLEEQFTFSPGEFTIKLLVDTAETIGNNAKRSRREEEGIAYLTTLGVPFEVRHLTVGDFAWVAQNGTSKELLLPYIVERKRSDDLAKSIKDGRFREQKFRLKQLQVEERIYLVEDLKNRDRMGLPYSTLMQAVTNTQVVDGFKVKFTSNLKDSMSYLAVMTEFLTEGFTKKILTSCAKEELPPFNFHDAHVRLMTFKDFYRDTGKKKKYTVGEMFLKQLLQLRGMSVEKSKAIVDVYPTPTHLMEAFRNYNSGDKRKMLAKLKVGSSGRSLGPVLSGTIYDFYTKNKFDL